MRFTTRNPSDRATALLEAQQLAFAIDGLTVDDGDASLAAYIQQMRGLAHLALFDESGDRTELAGGIGELAAAFEITTTRHPTVCLRWSMASRRIPAARRIGRRSAQS